LHFSPKNLRLQHEKSILTKGEQMTEFCARLVALRYHGSIAIATFESDSDRFVLYGDRRMTSILEEYVGEEIILFINDESDWSWRRVDED